MRVSLRQARRIEREIGAELELTTNTNRGGVPHVSQISVYEDVNQKIDAIQKQTLESLVKADRLIRLRFGIRKAIETENEIGGLNALMNQEAKLRALQKVLVSISGSEELTDEARTVAVARHAATKSQLESGTAAGSTFHGPRDTVNLDGVLTTETLARVREQSKAVQRELLVVVDKLSALNAGREIEISDIDVKALEEFGIVV